jgi:hypothetical protein
MNVRGAVLMDISGECPSVLMPAVWSEQFRSQHIISNIDLVVVPSIEVILRPYHALTELSYPY